MQSFDYMLDPPDEWEPPEWALDEICALEERNEYIDNLLRDYETLVDWYDSLNETDLAQWYCNLIADLEEERYDNQIRLTDLEDPKSEIYNPPPEGDD